ncbi:hypothetical protein [Methylobacterium sp. PvR107]|uniref:hypothetical protein n=1 Tax=Methylobacterium sp. PvR107 TaxID=2806597 RepID=UPI001AEB78B9|nr:hypothetical protein [Methylobacterium sp. PvR107]MBP1179420.1 outer membrane receptor protein involved in Fe transport [Methylobacterium sp. PvR107]
MSHRTVTLTAALTMAVAALLPAAASEATLGIAAHGAFSVPAVIGAAYHTPGLALSAADVRAQGGLLVPALTRWQDARPATASVEPFKVPATITVAYRNRNVATDAAQVLKQGGFATVGAVRWLPDAPNMVEANTGTVKLGSLEAKN